MPTYRLDFYLRRKVTAFIQAEDEADIDEFLTTNSDFNALEDYPEIIEHDETFRDEDDEGDYELTQVEGITAGWQITPGGELVETE